MEDHFAWMRDVGDAQLIELLEAENAWAEGWFAAHAGTVEAVFDEIRSRVQETDDSIPVRDGPWWYVTSTVEGLDHPVHHRGPSAHEAKAQVVLDENAEARRAGADEHFELGALDASHDHRMYAWSIDTTGDERHELRIRRFDDGSDGGRDLDERIEGVAHAGTAWSAQGSHLFYVRPDDQERPHQVWRHRVGTSADLDELVLTEHDERFFVEIGETRSDAWIVIHSASKTSSEVRLLASDDPLGDPRVVWPRADDVEYQVDDWGDRLVAVTNRSTEPGGAEDFRVVTSRPDGHPHADWSDPSEWDELVAHRAGCRIVGVDPFADHLVVSEWDDARPRLRIVSRDASERVIDLGVEPHDVHLGANPDWEASTVRFSTQSMTTPATLYDEDVADGTRRLLRRVPTPGVDLDAYVASRTWARSADGTAVPIDLVRHVDTPLDASAPGCLYAYGAYEASVPPWFSVARLSLLDRGVVWALAHPRGGGELGRRWYLDGKLERKQNTFDDVIASAEHLLATNVVAPGRLALRGGSAGGLLVGACTTQRPDLFASAVAEVPFVDIVNTMSDPTLPLTITEWEEWGDPRSEPHASAMLAYSPYDNTVGADYPALYVTSGLHDPRVSVHEPAKWVARLREVSTGDRPLLMRTEMGAGHGGPSGRYDAWRDEARTLAFLLATT